MTYALRVFFLIFKRHIKIVIKNKITIISYVLLYVLSMYTLGLCNSYMNLDAHMNFEYKSSFRLFFIVFITTTSVKEILINDYKKEILHQFLLTPYGLEGVITAKIAGHASIYSLILPTIILFEKYLGDEHFYIMEILTNILIIFIIVSNATLASSFMLGSSVKLGQIAISLMVNIPIILLGSIWNHNPSYQNLMILIGMLLITLSIAIITSCHLVKIAIEEG